MYEKICHVIGAGDFFDRPIIPAKDDYTIAVDGGYRYTQKIGLKTDMLIGDFDSLPEKPVHPNIVLLPKEKDDTDMLVALRRGLSLGFRVFYIYGGTGGRLEHTLANIQCLAYLSKKQARGYLFGESTVTTALTDTAIIFGPNYRGYVSMFSHSDVSYGVSIRCLKYELDNVRLTNEFPLGISNEFTGQESSISVKKGTLLILFPYLKSEFHK